MNLNHVGGGVVAENESWRKAVRVEEWKRRRSLERVGQKWCRCLRPKWDWASGDSEIIIKKEEAGVRYEDKNKED